jgi:GDP-L-fucose synthase
MEGTFSTCSTGKCTRESNLEKKARIYVAGGDTLLGTAVLDRLQDAGFRNLVGVPPYEPDLTVAGQVEDFFAEARPEYVFHTAGESGGIRANQTRPADLMLHNLLVTAHVLQSAHAQGVRKLLYLASSCSYPREAPQPLRIESLMTRTLEPTSAAYATAKLAGIQLCQAFRRQHGALFISAIPASPFGPHDHFSAQDAHVIPALIRKLHEAKCRGAGETTIWGSGKPRREFIFAPDLADACLFVMARYDDAEPINLGGGPEQSIAELAQLVADVVGYPGRLVYDTSKPDGAPLKALDSTRLAALGWKPATDFRTALEQTYAWYRKHLAKEGPVRVLEAL